VEQKNDNGIKPRVANQISVEEALQNGHDDAAARGGVAAVQADLLRAGRRLVAGGGQPGAELRGIDFGFQPEHMIIVR
jgi:hypothetical protein